MSYYQQHRKKELLAMCVGLFDNLRLCTLQLALCNAFEGSFSRENCVDKSTKEHLEILPSLDIIRISRLTASSSKRYDVPKNGSKLVELKPVRPMLRPFLTV
jgi:hypothetical protein